MSRNRNVLFVVAPLLVAASFATPRLLSRFRHLRPHVIECAPCTNTGCYLGINEYRRPETNLKIVYCLDYDGIPPGHCSNVIVYEYSIHDAATGDLKRYCFITDCQGTPDNSRPCNNPTPIGGGGYSAIGGGKSAPGSDTCKGDPTL